VCIGLVSTADHIYLVPPFPYHTLWL